MRQAVNAVLLLLLAAVLMTQAIPHHYRLQKDTVSDNLQSDPISENLQLPSLQEHIYLFDVDSESPLDDVKGVLTNNPAIEARHSFKEIGKGRYLFVVVSNDVTALRTLTFPAGSKVMQYPLEHTSEFLSMFGVKDAWDEVDDDNILPDTILLMHQLQLLQPMTLCLKQFEREMADWAEKYKATHQQVKPVSYAVVGAYPPKIFIFNKFEENAMQNVARMGLEQVGGPGRVLFTTTRIVKI